MKFNKLFFAAMTFAALAMVGCKDKKSEETTPTPTPPTPTPGEEAPVPPSLANPAAGKTTIAFYAEVCPKGAYLVGSINDYNINDDALSFTEVAGEKNWWQLTLDYDGAMQAKVIARPSDPDVAYNWAYQWGKNFDPDDPNCKLEEGTVNTQILKGEGAWVFENGGEVKLSEVKDGGVVYIWIKNWNASPVIEAKKLETAWVKSNFNNLDWAWYEMTKAGDGIFTFEGIWGGNGCNINATGDDGGAQWYPTDNEAVTLVDDPAKGDKVRVTFTSEKLNIGKLEIKMIEKGTPAADIPAGNGTFVVKVTNRTYKDGDKCILTGNFDEKSWGDSDRAMTYDAGTGKWSWKGDYPKNFEMKVIYNDKWSVDPNIVFDGKTFEYEVEIQGEE